LRRRTGQQAAFEKPGGVAEKAAVDAVAGIGGGDGEDSHSYSLCLTDQLIYLTHQLTLVYLTRQQLSWVV